MQLKNKRVLIVGFARTGVSLAKYVAGRGAKVTITDLKSRKQLEKNLKALGSLKKITYELGRHPVKTFLNSDMVIMSPGVPLNLPPLEKALNKKIPVMSELEFTCRIVKQPIIAITGTNGKTTTTMMIGHMLKRAKKSAFVGGNIGNALVNVLLSKEKYKYVVAEVSSFQLELIQKFNAKIAAILNISPDHMDRHSDWETYQKIKSRIFETQKATDYLILNDDDGWLRGHAQKAKSRIHYFKIGKFESRREGIYLKDNKFYLTTKQLGREQFKAENMKVRGNHNKQNMMVAVLIAKILKCNSTAIQQAIDTFEGVPHRLEFVKTRGYVDFYNDSKATNIDAVRRALESFSKPLILIMGGRDKGAPFEDLRSIIQMKVKILILMGESKSTINRALGDYTETFIVGTLDEATFMAYQKSRAGDVVLFSPGCSSFDEFKNYEERGERFKDLLRDL